MSETAFASCNPVEITQNGYLVCRQNVAKAQAHHTEHVASTCDYSRYAVALINRETGNI